jgi:transcriptional regulator with XRE-family HTH domain
VSDASATDGPHALGQIGSRLRVLRRQQELSLRELSERLGISPSALSQIENGRLQPSVNRLISIMNALGVPLAFAFNDQSAPDAESPAPAVSPIAELSVARAGTIDPIDLSTGVRYIRLTPHPIPGIELFESVYPPGAASSPEGEWLSHQGFETGHMRAGRLVVEHDGRRMVLERGDSVSFPARAPHRLVNPSATRSATILWLTIH